MLKIMLNTNKIHPVSKPNIFSAIFFTFQCFVDINFNQKWLISESLLSLKASRIVELLCQTKSFIRFPPQSAEICCPRFYCWSLSMDQNASFSFIFRPRFLQMARFSRRTTLKQPIFQPDSPLFWANKIQQKALISASKIPNSLTSFKQTNLEKIYESFSSQFNQITEKFLENQ